MQDPLSFRIFKSCKKDYNTIIRQDTAFQNSRIKEAYKTIFCRENVSMDQKDILIIHGTDYKNMAKKILERADVASDIGDPMKKVALKPLRELRLTASFWPEPLNISKNMVSKIFLLWRVPG